MRCGFRAKRTEINAKRTTLKQTSKSFIKNRFILQTILLCIIQNIGNTVAISNCSTGKMSRCSMLPSTVNPNAITLDISRVTKSIHKDSTELKIAFGYPQNARVTIEGLSNIRHRDRSRTMAVCTANACLNYLENFLRDLPIYARQNLHHKQNLLRKLRISSKIYSIRNLIHDSKELLSHMCLCDGSSIPELTKPPRPSFDAAKTVLEILDVALKRICAKSL